MQEEKYQEFLKTAPEDHFSEQFIQFLRDNNEVIEEKENWLIIKNVKYDWLTAFWKRKDCLEYETLAYEQLKNLLINYRNYEWKIKAPHKRSVKLFHVHLIQK